MSNVVTHTIGDTTYEIAPDATSEKVLVVCEYVGQAVSAHVEVGFLKSGITIMEDRSNGDIQTVITKMGDAIKFTSKGSIVSEDEQVSRVDESFVYKNAEEFRAEQPRIASAINNALAAINAVGESASLTAPQREMVRAYTSDFVKKEIAH